MSDRVYLMGVVSDAEGSLLVLLFFRERICQSRWHYFWMCYQEVFSVSFVIVGCMLS